MKENIIRILSENQKAYTVHELNDLLGLTTLDDFKNLIQQLNELENELKVYRTKKDKYILFDNSNQKLGRFIGHKKGYGFVDIEGDEDVFVAPPNINGAIHDDEVVVEITSRKGLDLEGRIIRVVKREFEELVGEIIEEKNRLFLKLDEQKIKLNVEIDSSCSMGAMPGHKVVVKIGKKLERNHYKGQVIRLLGHKNDPGVDILSITNKYHINDLFDELVMEELNTIPDVVEQRDIKNRRDLRDEVIFTIDGDDTKDIDDALSFIVLPNGNYKLGVHIADVSYYVRPNTKLDEEACARGTSVYLADRVIPMLPHKLSNGICSLNPNVDRLAISCEMEIDQDGKVIDADIFESIIKSRIQMTYKKVNLILEQDQVPDGYEPYAEMLKQMQELASILRKSKIKRGYIDFELEESKIIVDDEGTAIDVVLRERGMGERLIEDFMIVANETVATHIHFMELPFVYRVHGTPNEEKIKSFLNFVGYLGYKVTGDLKKITPRMMQDILGQLKDKKEFHILSSLLLRSMQKAVYDSVNIGHFGLGSTCYTHFTSPIRRYPDTTVHRLLRLYLFDHKIDPDTTRYWEEQLPALTLHCSEKERDAVECEREVDDMKKAEYMEKHINEEYVGMISSVMPFGLFVELPNLIEGLIHIEDLTDDYYTYIEHTCSLIGSKNKKGYRLGDVVKVVVKAASKEARTVDFVLAHSPKEKRED